MPEFAIRQLRQQDLEGALDLSTTAGWNQQADDWRMLLRIAPGGSFAAIAGDRIAGTAIGIDYGGFGWIAMMLVAPEHRGHGLGSRLLQAALESLPAARPVRLDATPLGRPLYERFGFRDEAVLTRHVAPAAPRRATVDTNKGITVAPIDAADLDEIARRDREVFGGERRTVLEWSLGHAPQYAFRCAAPAGTARYCFGRRGRLFDQIGPVVAADGDGSAMALVEAAHARAGSQALVIDSYDGRGAFTSWLQSLGFSPQRPLFRMCLPRGPRAFQSSGGEYAIFGPEFG